MIRGVISNNSILGISYALNASAGGKLSLPVDAASLIYSQLKNVSGVPAPEGSRGVTISKLNILDALIERINRMKKTAAPVHNSESLNDRVDSMIENYSAQIRRSAASDISSYALVPKNPEGALFRLTV